MARRRKSDSSRSYDNLERVLSNNTTAVRAVLDMDQYYQPAPTTFLFTEIEDYRRFHPEGELRTPMTVSGSPASFGVTYGRQNQKGVRSATSGLGSARSFRDAQRVVVCVRRKERREVLFAKGLRARGAGARRTRSFRSTIRCK